MFWKSVNVQLAALQLVPPSCRSKGEGGGGSDTHGHCAALLRVRMSDGLWLSEHHFDWCVDCSQCSSEDRNSALWEPVGSACWLCMLGSSIQPDLLSFAGCLEDWVHIREKAEHLKQYGLEWWLDVLLPVLDQFVMAAQGSPDKAFWRSMCNMHGLSSVYSEPVSGWIQARCSSTVSAHLALLHALGCEVCKDA
jgi:Domain of unknown function (DUF4419)